MRNVLFPLALVLCGAVVVSAADTMPTRKAGLWETTMNGGSAAATTGVPSTVKQCIDAATDRAAMSGAMAGKACEQGPIVKTAAGYQMEATCKIAGTTSSSKSLVSGDFNSKVTVSVTSVVSTGSGPAKETKMTLESRYLGPCEAGQKPGDIIMPDGKVIRVPMGGDAAR